MRVLTALLLIPLVFLAVSYAPAWVLAAALAALAAAGYAELHGLAAAQGVRSFGRLGGLFAAAFALAPALGARPALGLTSTLLAALVLVLLLQVVLGSRPLAAALPSLGATLAGVLWVGFLMSYLLALHVEAARLAPGAVGAPASPLLYTLLIATWLGDSAAYYAGRRFGRRKLAPRLSPGKTVAGLVGGVVACVLAVAVCGRLFRLWSELEAMHVLLLGPALALGGVAGDLAESGLKRGAGVKDSGRLFPGHGGVLDRLDSLLFAAPVMYHYFLWLRPL